MSWNERERRPSACAKASRCILVTFNVLTWLFGLILVGLCLWVLYEPTLFEVRAHLRLLDGYKTGLVMAISIAVGVCLLSMIGYCVSWYRSSRGLFIYCCLCLILIIDQIVAMAFIFNYIVTDKITPWFSEKIRNMIVLSKVHKQDAITFLDHVQERLKCCGGRSFVDYTENEMDMPWSCYYGEGNVQLRGCGEVLVQHFRENALAVGLVTLGILFLQIGLCACALVQFFDKQVVRPRLQASSV